MKTQIKLIKTPENRFQTIDLKGDIYSDCKTKSDAKKILKAKKWLDQLELVEEFKDVKDVKDVKIDQLTELEANFFYRFCEANGSGAKTLKDLEDDNYSWQAFEDLQLEFSELNDSQIKGYISTLESKGYIGIEKRKGDCDLFFVNVDYIIEGLDGSLSFESQIKDVKYATITKSPKKSVKKIKSETSQKINKSSYNERRDWILANAKKGELFGKSKSMIAFAKYFSIQISKRGQCRSWDDLLVKMANNKDGIEFAEADDKAKRRKLIFNFTKEV